MSKVRQLLTGEAGALPTEEPIKHDLSFYCITRKEDAKYLTEMLDSLPTNVEVVIVETVHDKSRDGELVVDKEETINGRDYVLARWFYAGWDFARARNAALTLCKRGWCFWMDTDDRLLPFQHGNILAITTDLPPGVAGVMVGCYGYQPPYKDGERGAFYAVPHCRAHRNLPGLQWRGKVHEQIEPQIKDLGYTTVEADIGVYHVGYVVDRETMTAKMGRNVVMLCQQIASDRDYLPDYYTTALKNNIHTYLDMKEN